MLHPDVDLDALRDQFANAEPFGHVVIDQFLEEHLAREIEQALPSYQQALHVGTSFKTVNETRKVQIEDSRQYAPPVLALHDFLNGSDFRKSLGYICGIEDLLSDPKSNGGGIHQTGPGGRLDVHVDFNYLPELKAFRRLNLLLYLNSDWDETWGGHIELWDPDVKVCHRSVAPLLNRCLIFETNNISYHGVTRVECPPGHVRKSYSTYYYSNSPPADFTDDFHGTVFKARPNEKWKGRIWMPLEGLLRRWRLKR